MVQTAEGALNEVHDMLQRMNELAVQAANGTNATEDRNYIDAEVQQLKTEIDRVKSTTTFNGQNLLTGSFNKGLQVGADANQVININIGSLGTAGLGVSAVVVSTATKAQSAISSIKSAITTLNEKRSALGAVQNRLEHTINNLNNITENTQSAESAIRDTDMATEMVKYSNGNILAQAGQAMLAQANQSNQGVLSLLG